MLLPSLLLALLAAAPVQAGDRREALLVRLADPVARLDGRARSEEFLYFWDKSRPLAVGDGLRSGPAGIAELSFPGDGTRLRLHGAWHIFLEGTGDDGEAVLRCLELSRGRIAAGGRGLSLLLPGGATLTARSTSLRLASAGASGRLVVRNAGPGDVVLRSRTAPGGELTLSRGEEAALPLPLRGEDEASPAASGKRWFWGETLVEQPEGTEVTVEGEAVRVLGARAVVGGARLLPAEDETYVVRRPAGRRGES